MEAIFPTLRESEFSEITIMDRAGPITSIGSITSALRAVRLQTPLGFSTHAGQSRTLHNSVTDQRTKKLPTAGSWKPGCPSPNPNGRPRAGTAFAERVRERVDPDLVIELALRVAGDEALTPSERLAALWPLIDRGFVKPPTTINASVTSSVERDWSALPIDERRELLERLRAVPKLGESGLQPDVVTDDNVTPNESPCPERGQ